MSNLKQLNVEKNTAANVACYQPIQNQFDVKYESSKDQIEYVQPLIPKRLTTTLAYNDKIQAREVSGIDNLKNMIISSNQVNRQNLLPKETAQKPIVKAIAHQQKPKKQSGLRLEDNR